MWVQAVLAEIGLRNGTPPMLLYDNLSATYMAANTVFHNRTKHIKLDNHFIKQRMARK